MNGQSLKKMFALALCVSSCGAPIQQASHPLAASTSEVPHSLVTHFNALSPTDERIMDSTALSEGMGNFEEIDAHNASKSGDPMWKEIQQNIAENRGK